MDKLKNIIQQRLINHIFRNFYGKSYDKLENRFLISMLRSKCDLVGVLLQVSSATSPLDLAGFDFPVALCEHRVMLLKSLYMIKPPNGKNTVVLMYMSKHPHWSLQAW